ncbi:hypothetical protein N9M66_04705 [Litoreibacter sp.]|nr:hypothetical protein [Litoreibacter sp.]
MSETSENAPRRPEFLEQDVYRRRRLIDAVKLLPVLGACLFLVPALILGGEAGSTATRLVYFFLSWFGLILICALLVRRLTQNPEG